MVGISRIRASEIVGNANFGKIDTLLSEGHDMEYIASHYHMDLALAWSLRLEGKTDQEKFKELGWGLRTWDYPPYYIKKEKATEKVPSISSYSKERYGEFIEGFFTLACKIAK